MTSTTTRQRIKTEYQNANRNGFMIDKNRAYIVNLDRDVIMAMIKLLHAVYNADKILLDGLKYREPEIITLRLLSAVRIHMRAIYYNYEHISY